ncbi:hypothetical protein NCC49_000571 [Naganishia albida]|nr:hypothetical protein NCC49_000571 [Naganishia albida]
MNPNFEPEVFRESEGAGWIIPSAYTAALALHLETIKYTDEAYHQGLLKRIDPSELRGTQFIGWRSYRSDSDAGSQRYRRAWRQGDDPKSGIWRDTSWVTYTQYVEKNAQLRGRNANFRKGTQWGLIQQFLQFTYESVDFSVAIIQPYLVEKWINKINEPPLRILRKEGTTLQVVSVEFLDAVLGRIPHLEMDGWPCDDQILFDSSMGRLRG